MKGLTSPEYNSMFNYFTVVIYQGTKKIYVIGLIPVNGCI